MEARASTARRVASAVLIAAIVEVALAGSGAALSESDDAAHTAAPRADAVGTVGEGEIEARATAGGEVELSFVSDVDQELASERAVAASAGDTVSADDVWFEWNVSSTGAVELTWSEVAGAISQQVFRDGVLQGHVRDESWADDTAVPGAVHEYRVEMEVDGGSELVRDPFTGEEVLAPQRSSVTIVTSVPVPAPHRASRSGLAQVELAAEATAAARVAATGNSKFRYLTFIAPATAPGFPCVAFPTNTYFGGDNRSYSATSTKYRTRATITMNWSTGKLTQSRGIGTTINYNNNGTERSRKRASASEMVMSNTSVSSTRASFRLNHRASNPYCSGAQAIRYDVSVSLYKSGSYIISGYRRPVPNHEAYVQSDSGAWRTVFRLPNEGFHCLTGVCGTDSLSYSN
ncbi:DUF3238 domain-containing protein [Demequina globuliformis]|uniref:DUF3238 domain-containing protein n=1 Tax=Demequina globuliformis TaxID=676202 RepID=UPI000785FC09|nr:DUF3238 domain-containing protein [Demequina globuliformis]